MSFAIERWKKSVNKLTRTDSMASSIMMNSRGSVVDEETNEEEVERYLKNLKTKTGLKGLWTGGKFDNMLDDDKTPDISISSSDNEAKGFNLDFRKINMDSDEDEMRIDYLREASVDVNNNIDNDDDDDDNEDFNLMQNIRFAELNFDDVQLTDEENLKGKQTNDYLPILYTVNVSKSNSENHSEEVSDYQIGNNIKFLDSVESALSNNSSKDDHSIQSVPDSIVTDVIKSEIINSEYSELQNSKTSHADSYSPTDFETEVSCKSKSERKDKKKKKTKSSFTSITCKSSRSKDSVSNSDLFSKGSCQSSKSKSYTSSSDSENTLSSTASDVFSSSYVSTEKSSKTQKTELSSKKSRTSNKSHRKEHKKRRSATCNTVETQTNDTYNVLQFKYPWQLGKPHNIAAVAVAPETLDVLTSYSPTILAAHDMIKYHFQLLQQHIENSRRLYESYSALDNQQTNFQYTTVEDTMKFIAENQPRVSTFEEALKKIKEEENCD